MHNYVWKAWCLCLKNVLSATVAVTWDISHITCYCLLDVMCSKSCVKCASLLIVFVFRWCWSLHMTREVIIHTFHVNSWTVSFQDPYPSLCGDAVPITPSPSPSTSESPLSHKTPDQPHSGLNRWASTNLLSILSNFADVSRIVKYAISYHVNQVVEILFTVHPSAKELWSLVCWHCCWYVCCHGNSRWYI